MATAPIIGVGYLIANDILTDVAFRLLEPCVNTTFPAFPAPPTPAGLQTVPVWDPSMYVGAQIIAGVIGGDAEVVTVSAINPGVSFTATFVNAHPPGEPIVGATFPVQNSAGDSFYLQSEMLGYLAEALNDFLLRVPLVYSISTAVSVGPTEPIAALPSDLMVPMRVAAFGIALRETSQSNLDSYDYRWNVQSGNEPYTYFRDKVGLQNIGVWPRANNTTPLEIIYQQRSGETLNLADGFVLPDPFLVYVKARVLWNAYSKDGEQRSPALAKFYDQRYENGIKIAKMILEVVNDQTMQ